MSAVQRIKEIRKRKQRTQKLRNLRARYAISKSEDEKRNILEKVRRIALWLTEEEFLQPIQPKKVAAN